MLWYLSFATKTKFLGATVVEAADEKTAFKTATERGLNPGGEVAIWGPIPPSIQEAKAMLNRLASEDELRAGGGKKLKELDEDMLAVAEENASIVCDNCNP